LACAAAPVPGAAALLPSIVGAGAVADGAAGDEPLQAAAPNATALMPTAARIFFISSLLWRCGPGTCRGSGTTFVFVGSIPNSVLI
jgi:hypothetical protein